MTNDNLATWACPACRGTVTLDVLSAPQPLCQCHTPAGEGILYHRVESSNIWGINPEKRLVCFTVKGTDEPGTVYQFAQNVAGVDVIQRLREMARAVSAGKAFWAFRKKYEEAGGKGQLLWTIP